MTEFPPDVRRFVVDAIDSIEQLEVLLLLRSSPDRSWTADEVSRALYTHPNAAVQRLVGLHTLRLLASEAEGAERRYRYAPTEPAQADVVERLAALYKERRVAVITLVYSKPIDQVQAFADAFRLRKEGS